jgi:hypothetical protein
MAARFLGAALGTSGSLQVSRRGSYWSLKAGFQNSSYFVHPGCNNHNIASIIEILQVDSKRFGTGLGGRDQKRRLDQTTLGPLANIVD